MGLKTYLESVRQGVQSVSQAAREVDTTLKAVRESQATLAQETEKRLEDAVVSVEGASQRVAAAQQAIQQNLQTLDDDVPQRVRRLNALLDTLAATAEAGNVNADSLFRGIKAAQEGLLSVHDLIASFDQAPVLFEGRIQPINSLLNDLLPRLSETQGAIRDFIDQVKGQDNEIEALIGRLRDNFSAVSQGLAGLVEGILAGRGTIDDLVRALDGIRAQGFAGSEADVLGDRLAQLLRQQGIG